MIKPKEIKVKNMDGEEKNFIISRFPATVGMEIIYKLPLSAIPKIGDFDKLKEVRDEVFKYVCVKTDNGDLALTTKALIDNHTSDAETAIKIMKETLEYNYSFFQNGIISAFLARITEKIPTVAQKILSQFLQSSSRKTKRH